MRWFNRLKVGNRFLIIGLIILPFLAALGGTGVWGVLQINARLQNTQSNEVPGIYNLGKVSDKIQEVRLTERQIMIAKDSSQIQQMEAEIQTNLEAIQNYWQKFLSYPVRPAENALISQFEYQWKIWNSEVEEFLQIAEVQAPEAARRKAELVTTPSSRQLFNLANNLNTINYQEVDDSSEAGRKTLNEVLLVLGLSAAGVIVVILLAGLGLARSIISLTSNQNRLNQELSKAFRDLESKRRLGEETSDQLKTITAELNVTSTRQTSRSQEQAAAVIQVTTSLNELGEAARQIAGNASQVSANCQEGLALAEQLQAAARLANKTAECGESTVGNAVQAIEEVQQGFGVLAVRFNHLTESSHQISQIIKLIKGISDETHLLALNAAIESAGAGEAGQRFKVVAQEIKNLANRSLEATGEVAEVINGMREAVTTAAQVSEETREKTLGAVEKSYQAGQVIRELGQVVDETAASADQIVRSVRQITTLTGEISLATRQQDSAVRQISQTMQGIGEAAQENASAVAQVSATVGQMDRISSLLKTTLDQNELQVAGL